MPSSENQEIKEGFFIGRNTHREYYNNNKNKNKKERRTKVNMASCKKKPYASDTPIIFKIYAYLAILNDHLIF